ncbi:hypothetical protein [Hamadaea tsunoensis]|uniref:hypothetical protein n=1 Tax=Hamadaea tsunoensis TaxID=53368 RepID=UPI0012F7C35A|nr:hypothetical protein [Hamadaea tsunoensis]
MIPRSLVRRLAVLGAVLAAGVGTAVVTAPAPASASVLTTCVGTSQQTYQPPLTLTTRPTSLSVVTTLAVCGGGLTGSFSLGPTPPADASCLLNPPAVTATVTIHWNNGLTSTITAVYAVSRSDGQTVSQVLGSVTSGLFAGAAYTQTSAGLDLDPLACAGSGVATNSGPILATFDGL